MYDPPPASAFFNFWVRLFWTMPSGISIALFCLHDGFPSPNVGYGFLGNHAFWEYNSSLFGRWHVLSPNAKGIIIVPTLATTREW